MPARDDEERKVQSHPVSLSSAHIAEAVSRSPDGGLTLFLSKLGLSDIGAHEATELAMAGRKGPQENDSVVERLALGNNRLTALPTEFALLTHLRYLNLRHNSFVSFPDVLTILPSLDTLDLSYNKLKRFPPYPGNLTTLKILSLSRNKITRLPSFLIQFKKLEVLQLDRNLIDWPPSAVLESFGDTQDLKKGKEWVRKLQNWMNAESAKNKEFEDSGYSERIELKDGGSNSESWRFPMQAKIHSLNLTPHARSFSIDSDVSTQLVVDPISDVDTNKQTPPSKSRRPLNLATNTKPLAQALDLSEILSTPFTPAATDYLDALPEPEAMHLRTASHASTLRKPQLSAVAGKQSMPDLRTGRDTKKYNPIFAERSTSATTPDFHQDSGSSYGSLPPAYDEDASPPNPRIVPIVSVERCSYFRRSSAIPINNSLPQPLRALSLSSRGLLFALGQLYQTLDQYSHQDGNEHLSTIRKVLEPANVTMLHLIRSLDRFDDVSQKSTPSPAVCRALVESCRDTVTVFRKAAGLLVMQMGCLLSEDVRYVRWLILELYAASAELSHGWQCMVAQLESLKPFLSNNFLKPPSFGSVTIIDNVANSLNAGDYLAPSIRLRTAEVTQAGRTRTARRHAGSFSTKDVQMGKELPSYDILPSMAGGLASDSQTPTLRTPKRQVTLPVVTSTPNSSASSFTPSFTAPPYSGSFSDSFYHHRGHSQGSIADRITLPSPAFVYNSHSVAKSHGQKDVLRAIQRTVDLAPMVWDQIEEVLGDLATSNQDIHESIEQARSVTKRLSDDVAIMSEGYSDADERLLRENAHLFVKALVVLSNILKTYLTPRAVSSSLRTNMVTLTQSTEDFAVLLPISSISSNSTHSYSPTFSNSQYAPYNGVPQDDNQLPPSLSRSRSEQPSIRYAKQSLAPPNGSATTSFSSRTNVTKSLRLTRETSLEKADPG